eukprot:TRINITY_DN9773_c0_g1_i1.p1 TRINITY_DN9773_c0_g1~~TRINITY_DN9773_c0_g1_i1.p1  ORF type:complete len:539 (-),score=155.53 TRINITY_DN9773_c0_g1_i1:57-1529(-)
MYTAADVEAHQGNDARYYLCDFGRLFPPEYPLEQNEQTKYSHLYKLFRPEFVVKNPTPLCSDALSGFVYYTQNNKEHNRGIRDATLRLLDEVIPVCGQAIDDSKTSLETSFSEILHREGVNMRYLRQIAVHSKSETNKMLLITEAIARTMKSMMRMDMRSVNTGTYSVRSGIVQSIIQNLNLFFGRTQESDNCWNGILRKEILILFPVVSPDPEDKSEFQRYLNVDDLPENLKQYCLDFKLCDQNGSPSGMIRIYKRLMEMLRIVINPGVKVTNGFFKHAHPLEEADLISTGLRIKSMNLLIRLNALYYHTIGLLKLKTAKKEENEIVKSKRNAGEDPSKLWLIKDAEIFQKELEDSARYYFRRGVEYCTTALKTTPYDLECVLLFVIMQASLGETQAATEKAKYAQNFLASEKGTRILPRGCLRKMFSVMVSTAPLLTRKKRDFIINLAGTYPVFNIMARECEVHNKLDDESQSEGKVNHDSDKKMLLP